VIFVALSCESRGTRSTWRDSWKGATGTLTVAPDGGAPIRLDVDKCWSGARLMFRGVELLQNVDTSRRIRLVEDPVTGPRVVLLGLVSSNPRVIIDPTACAAFEEHLVGTNEWVNEVQSLEGSLRFKCDVRDVGTVAADIEFSDCSFDNRARGM
jgi:hypothetical protein